ncbi:sugar phosphate nucleotidyltransferase [Clostridium tetanomorphum]|uniref:NTP transferase domain-containing protein n=2 Tax=Clostridium tetanomorphum TaxID=1553 RepID=A0A923E832_CLOTT|nr:sugar phosphate nucleotidyltransferase [Clostridium tetanomorphum]MBC2398173.1 NTP transferase domain-containing protein [Clostridium tetanomorphum]NRZ98838.1 mannose-1-phosphate guanylyltransferase/phosphomannomutase [Clostridium tetanomorphum]
MKAMIMAGGQGQRLRPLTCNIPKPMMPILDKPIIQYTIELLKDYGIKDIGITLQYLPDEIMDYFDNGEELGVNIRYFIEEYPLGTAGSIKNGEEFLDDTFLVISGDAFTDIDISKAIDFHKNKKAIATIILKETPIPLDFGVVVTEESGKITGFLEKPSWREVFSDKINTGIYILEPDIFKYYEKNQKFDFSQNLFPLLLNNGENIYGYVDNGYWCDIGNAEQYMMCQFNILNGEIKAKDKEINYDKGIWIEKNCEISSEAKLEPPVFIGSGTKIYRDTSVGPYAILGKNNIISPGATVKRSITFDNCYIGNCSEVRGAILCKNVQIESMVCVCEESIVGDNTLLKKRTIIKPNVKIWPDKTIESRSVIDSNIIWNEKSSKLMFGKYGASGEINLDMTPEVLSKLGSAYGGLLKHNSKVSISCSNHRSAQMIKHSISIGLLTVGIQVYDFGTITIPMARSTILFLEVEGSIHVFIEENDPERVNILFMDKDGVDIDKTMERKIENNFRKGDFRRVKGEELKELVQLSHWEKYYINQIVNSISYSELRKKVFKVVLNVKDELVYSILKEIFMELGIKIKIYERYNDISGLKKEVLNSTANLGIWINSYGDKTILIDENGNIIEDDDLHALIAFIILKTTGIKTLAVPINYSSSLENVAALCNVKSIRTKTSHRNILDTYLKNEKKLSRRDMVNLYLNTLDPIKITITIMDFMTKNNLTLSSIMDLIPKYYRVKNEIICSLNERGRVMRNIIEETSEHSIDIMEGIKLKFKDCWALISQDEEEPMCKLFVESKDKEEGDKIADYLMDTINSIVKK